MKPKWLKLAGELLELGSEQLSNRGCNDWEWPKDWTEADRREFMISIVEQNYDVPLLELREPLRTEEMKRIDQDCAGTHGPPDWWVASFLAGELRKAGGDA